MVFIRRCYYSKLLYFLRPTEVIRLCNKFLHVNKCYVKNEFRAPSTPTMSEDFIVEAWYYDLAHEVAEKR